MISFIIVGKDIENTISICIKSVIGFIGKNNIKSSEIIYVDSNSKDRTIDIAKKFDVKVIRVKGEVNSAIGRNVGVKNSNGQILFFIDGDMQLKPDLYPVIFNPDSGKLKYPFSNGYWRDDFYDKDFNFLYSVDPDIPDQPTFIHVTGGLMAVERELWLKVNGMDERLIRSQDHDFGLRISKSGFPAKRYNYLFAIHHTSNYYDISRSRNFFLGMALFAHGILYRKHLFYKPFILRYKRNLMYLAFLFITLMSFILTYKLGIIMLFVYFLIQIFRVSKEKQNWTHSKRSFLYKFLYNFYVLIGLLFYFPGVKKYKVEVVSS